MSKDLSIVIAYYNTGNYIDETLESIELYDGSYNYEIIIIDDGSNEENSIKKLDELRSSGRYKIIHQLNKGPGASRNLGCKEAIGRYILFIDSDDKLIPNYIDKAVKILDNEKDIGVIYTNCIAFGEEKREVFKAIPFDISALLASNFISICSFVRKTAFDEVGGFDEDPKLRVLEDWDLWLSIYKKGWGFKLIEQPMFYYRLRPCSLISNEKANNIATQKRIAYVYAKHSDLLVKQYPFIYGAYKAYHFDKKRPLRSFFKYIYLKFWKKN